MRFDPFREIEARFHPRNAIAVDVYLEARRARVFVGRLRRLESARYFFNYDERYHSAKRSLALSPDLPLTQKEHQSEKLFPVFLDRIPSSKRPVYGKECARFGISPKETEPFVLLLTLGKRDDSPFVLEPVWPDTFGAEEVLALRRRLGLTFREFGALFGVSTTTIQRLEKGTVVGSDTLTMLELCDRFPEAVLYEVAKNGGQLHTYVKERLIKELTKELGQKLT